MSGALTWAVLGCAASTSGLASREAAEPAAPWALAETAKDGGRISARLGVVDRRSVDLDGITLVLGVADRCRKIPVDGSEEGGLTTARAKSAGCRTRVYDGSLSVHVDAEGGAPLEIQRIAVTDGFVRLSFADLSRASQLAGAGGLWNHRRLLLGDAGWAGAVDLRRLEPCGGV